MKNLFKLLTILGAMALLFVAFKCFVDDLLLSQAVYGVSWRVPVILTVVFLFSVGLVRLVTCLVKKYLG